MEVEIDLSELQEATRRFPGVIERALELTVMELDSNLRKESPVDHGRLAGSWQAEQISPLEWGLTSGLEYTMAVNEGTPPHRIEPVSAKVLRFEIDGQEVFCKYVDHPGTDPNPYIDRSIEATAARADEFASTAIEEVIGGTA